MSAEASRAGHHLPSSIPRIDVGMGWNTCLACILSDVLPLSRTSSTLWCLSSPDSTHCLDIHSQFQRVLCHSMADNNRNRLIGWAVDRIRAAICHQCRQSDRCGCASNYVCHHWPVLTVAGDKSYVCKQQFLFDREVGCGRRRRRRMLSMLKTIN